MGHAYDLVIIGSGPAGLAAAIYAERAQLDTVVIEKESMSGGQVLSTYEVDNYPGMSEIDGFDLGTKFREHADRLGAEFVQDTVIRVEDKGNQKEVICKNEIYTAKTVIIATGASHRKLGVPGEEELAGRGVSYCATPVTEHFFRDKITAVIGGGDVAVEDAIFLARMCKHVYVIHRRDEFRAAKRLQSRLKECENVTVLWDTVVEEIAGEDKTEYLKIYNKKTEERNTLLVQGVFIAVGIIPNSKEYEGLAEMEHGYFVAGEDCKTSVPGIFAAGDVRTKELRQIITAASDGANAVTSVEKYLTE